MFPVFFLQNQPRKSHWIKQCAFLLNVSLRFLLNTIHSNHCLTTQVFNFQMFGHFPVLIQEGKKVTGTSSGLYEKGSTTGDLREWEHPNTWNVAQIAAPRNKESVGWTCTSLCMITASCWRAAACGKALNTGCWSTSVLSWWVLPGTVWASTFCLTDKCKPWECWVSTKMLGCSSGGVSQQLIKFWFGLSWRKFAFQASQGPHWVPCLLGNAVWNCTPCFSNHTLAPWTPFQLVSWRRRSLPLSFPLSLLSPSSKLLLLSQELSSITVSLPELTPCTCPTVPHFTAKLHSNHALLAWNSIILFHLFLLNA